MIETPDFFSYFNFERFKNCFFFFFNITHLSDATVRANNRRPISLALLGVHNRACVYNGGTVHVSKPFGREIVSGQPESDGKSNVHGRRGPFDILKTPIKTPDHGPNLIFYSYPRRVRHEGVKKHSRLTFYFPFSIIFPASPSRLNTLYQRARRAPAAAAPWNVTGRRTSVAVCRPGLPASVAADVYCLKNKRIFPRTYLLTAPLGRRKYVYARVASPSYPAIDSIRLNRNFVLDHLWPTHFGLLRSDR